MNVWREIWEFCLIASLVIFAGMSILVSIGGAFDIRRLLRRLSEQKPDED